MRIPAVDRLVAILGYIPFLFLIPVLLRRDSLFAQFHGRQAGVLWGIWFTISSLLLLVLAFLPGPTQSSLGVYFFAALYLLAAIYLCFVVIGMWKAGTKERYRMPVVADVALMLRL